MKEVASRVSAPHLDDRSSGGIAPVSVTWSPSVEEPSCVLPERQGALPARKPLVTHSHAALAYCVEGSSLFEQNGHWRLSAGDVLLVPAGQPHRRVESRGAAYWRLGVCVPCYAKDDELRRVEPFERVRDGGGAVVRIPRERRSFLEHLFRELAAATESAPGAHTSTVQRSLLLLILNEVSAVTRDGAVTPDGAGSPRDVVVDSLRYIERHCLQRLTLQDVASAVGRTPAYVTTALSRATGKSALEWIISGRMAEARRLLLHSNDPVSHVAERVGYADVTHFIRLFRREHGKTPAAFRASVHVASASSE